MKSFLERFWFVLAIAFTLAVFGPSAVTSQTTGFGQRIRDGATNNLACVDSNGNLCVKTSLGATPVATAQPGQAKTAICDPATIANCATISPNSVFGDAVTGSQGQLWASAFGYGWNGAGWDRIRTTQTQGDTRTGILAIGACNAAPGANQCASVGGQADGQTGSLINGLATNSFLYSFNGTTLDRLRTTQAITGTGVGRLSTGVCDPTNALCLNVLTTGGSRNNSGLASFAAQDSTGLNEIDAADKSFTATITTNTTTLLIAAVAAKTQYLTSIDATVVSTTAGSLALKYGTQTTTPCDTGAVTLATYQFAANTPLAISRGSGLGSIMQPPPANNQECITTAGLTGTASVNGSFAQF